jgi:hypothetical protein
MLRFFGVGTLLLLVSCRQVFDLYPSVDDEQPEEEPWREVTVEQSDRGTFVIATRIDKNSWLDAGIEYRLYRVAQPWQLVDSGSADASEFDPRFISADAPYAASAHNRCAIDEDLRVRCDSRL